MEKDFWVNTKRVMKERGVTQQALADYLNLSVRTVQGWVTKDIHIDIYTGKLIADLLGCSLDYLMGDENGISITAEENKLLNLYREIPESCKSMLMTPAEQLATLKDKVKE